MQMRPFLFIYEYVVGIIINDMNRAPVKGHAIWEYACKVIYKYNKKKYIY